MLSKLLALPFMPNVLVVLLDSEDIRFNVGVCVLGTVMDSGNVAELPKHVVDVAVRSASESNCKRG